MWLIIHPQIHLNYASKGLPTKKTRNNESLRQMSAFISDIIS